MEQVGVVFRGKDVAVLERCSIEGVSAGSVLVRNHFSMISPGTELSLFTGAHVGFSDPEITWARYPLQPGYAAVGEVIAEGRFESASSPRPSTGDWVLHYGTHANLTPVDPRSALWVRLPYADGTSEDGSDLPVSRLRYLLVRFAQIAATAVLAQVRSPRNVLIFGAGIVGNLCAQLFQNVPGVERVFLVDLSRSRIEIARRCGVRDAYEVGEADQQITAISGGVDTIVEATGSPRVVAQALDRVAIGGQVLLLGSTRGQVELNVYKMIHRKLVSLVGCHETLLPVKPDGAVRRPIWELEGEGGPAWLRPRSHEEIATRLADAIFSGSLVVDPFLDKIVKPEEVQGAYEQLRDEPDRYLGVIIDWREVAP